jgi:hypothetical protein
VVDRSGRVAFIGRPQQLDDVLPRVLAGTWRGRADLDEIKAMNAELNDLIARVGDAAEAAGKRAELAGADRAAAVKAALAAIPAAAAEAAKALPAYEAKYPHKAKQTAYRVDRIAVHLQARQWDAAKAVSDELFKAGVERKDAEPLKFVTVLWASRDLNPERKHLDLAVRAAEEVLKLDGEADLTAVIGATRAYTAAGDAAKAKEYGEKALKLAGDNPKVREQVEKVLASFQQ